MKDVLTELRKSLEMSIRDIIVAEYSGEEAYELLLRETN